MSLHRRNGNKNGSRRRMLLKGVKGSSRPDQAPPLKLRLEAIAENLPISSIDEVWVFPPLPEREFACEFIVLICFDGGEDRRRILTAHVDARFDDPESDRFQWVQRVREHGTAPHSWVSGMPDRLLRRLADAGVPEVVEVSGQPAAFEEVLDRLAAANGNGNGGGASAASIAAGVDNQPLTGISLSTVIELGGTGTHSESGDGSNGRRTE